ncbi:hypothetical protein AB4097_06660 [Microvirga sp. 2MCAF35]|uniref:hypothetical protein n=1 Tax=Microvirga sp. 2MCAF35 TaxID=3232987 RepID=UPI003F9BA358
MSYPTTQSKHLSFRRVLALFSKALLWTFIAAFVALLVSCVVELNPRTRRLVYGPDHLASVSLEPEKVRIGIELTNTSPIGKAEFDRRLLITQSDNSTTVTELFSDHGGFAEANLYRMADGKLVLAGAFDAELITLSPLNISPYSTSYLANRDKGLYGKVDLRDQPFRKERPKRLGSGPINLV